MQAVPHNDPQKTPHLSTMKWLYASTLVAILAIEFTLRDFLLPQQPDEGYFRLAIAVELLILLGLVSLWLPRLEAKSLESIGLGRITWRHVGLGSGMYLVLMIAFALSGFLLDAIGLPSMRSLQPSIKELSLLTRVGIFLTGTFFEEVFYRGYLIERMAVLTGSRSLAAIASWLVFTLVHIRFFGLGPTIDVAVMSAVLVLLYLKGRSLWPCIVVHGINGLLGYLIFPAILR